MRLLFLSTWHPEQQDNGSKIRVYHLLRALAEKHDVTLCSFAFGTALPLRCTQLEALGIEVHCVPMDPFAANAASPLRTFLSAAPQFVRPIPAMTDLVSGLLAREHFDAVIASTELTACYARLPASPATRILEEHNCLSRWLHERMAAERRPLARARTWASWQKARRFEAALFRQFDLVTMVSAADGDYSRSLVDGKARIELTPNGVDCEHNRPAGRIDGRPHLVFNGSLTYAANFDAMQWFLAEIYPRIKRSVPGVSLTITGSTEGVSLVGLALDDTVSLTGYVDDVRIPVSKAHVCVVPLRLGGGTRLKILEAMALGVPVVATAKGAEGLPVVDGEHLLLADAAAAFAESTTQLLTDGPLRMRLRASARRLVETNFDWRTIGREFAALVEQAVCAHG